MSGIDLGAIAGTMREIVEQQEAPGGDATQLRLAPCYSVLVADLVLSQRLISYAIVV